MLSDETYLKSTDIVNNLTSTSTTKPLSAAQGKALTDNITSLNSALLNKSNDIIVRSKTVSGSSGTAGSINIKADNVSGYTCLCPVFHWVTTNDASSCNEHAYSVAVNSFWVYWWSKNGNALSGVSAGAYFLYKKN